MRVLSQMAQNKLENNKWVERGEGFLKVLK